MVKTRLTITVDLAVADAAREAVAAGRKPSVSAWVNEALAREVEEHTDRLAALKEALTAYEAEFGAFTEEELEEQRRADLDASARLRANRLTPRPPAQPE